MEMHNLSIFGEPGINMKSKLSKGLVLSVSCLQARNAQTKEDEITTEEQLLVDVKQWMDP